MAWSALQATLKLFGDPLAFEAEAGISVGKDSGLEIAGRTLAPWHPKGFDFLTIDNFAIKAIISPEAVPSLLELHAKLDVSPLPYACSQSQRQDVLEHRQDVSQMSCIRMQKHTHA